MSQDVSADDAALMVDGPTRETLRRLELEVTRRLDGLLRGNYRGLVPGHGTEPGETRRYEPGDDVRRIDWNVSARLPETYIRQTIAERELQTWLIVDRSARLDFGTQSREKRYLALAAATAVAYLTNRDGNRIGALLAGQPTEKIITPGGSRKHLLRILHELASGSRSDGSGVTNLGRAINRCNTLAKRSGFVAVISDFNVEPGWQTALGSLARKHDVVAVQVSDRREFQLPNVGPIIVQDAATGEQVEVPTQKASVRAAYDNRARRRQLELTASLRALRVDHLELSTDRPWLTDVARFIMARHHKLRHQTAARL